MASQPHGRWVGQEHQSPDPPSDDERPEDLQALCELLEAGKVTPLIDRTFPLREVPEAIWHMVEGRGHGGLIVITV
jgi:NADPH:quinone reductase-like Zn-dependent oxidoreductase